MSGPGGGAAAAWIWRPPLTSVAAAAAAPQPPAAARRVLHLRRSTCNASAAAVTYGGFDIELFRRAAAIQGWVESELALQWSASGGAPLLACALRLRQAAAAG